MPKARWSLVMKPFPYVTVLAAAWAAALPAGAATPKDIMRRIHDHEGGIIVAAHRGCHEKAPYHGWGTAPENSGEALMRCAALGVDIMETDVRKSRDGYLVMIHDETVDRTTDGHGAVADLTLAQLEKLHLRDNEGGASAPITDGSIMTLDEILALAKDRIVLNLDVKDLIYAEVIDAVIRAGAQDRVIVKTMAGIGSRPLASMSPYDRVPFMVIPRSGDPDGQDLATTMAQQMNGRIKPVAFELPRIPATSLLPIASAARTLSVRLWVNTLAEGFVTGLGSDADALRDPDAVWGEMIRAGVSIFQTDEPEALLRYRERLAHDPALRRKAAKPAR
jgi:glycerophosphoryl diester phosphodiesterase